MLNDAKTWKYLKLSIQGAPKLKARQGYYTTSMHGKHHSTKGPENRAKEVRNMNKISLKYGQNMLE